MGAPSVQGASMGAGRAAFLYCQTPSFLIEDYIISKSPSLALPPYRNRLLLCLFHLPHDPDQRTFVGPSRPSPV